MKQMYCPHFVTMGGLTRYCMEGKFPCNCDTCNHPDKRYVDVYTTNNTADKEVDNER